MVQCCSCRHFTLFHLLSLLLITEVVCSGIDVRYHYFNQSNEQLNKVDLKISATNYYILIK